MYNITVNKKVNEEVWGVKEIQVNMTVSLNYPHEWRVSIVGDSCDKIMLSQTFDYKHDAKRCFTKIIDCDYLTRTYASHLGMRCLYGN